jgi:Co/Zn/Cd efflux system component
MSGCCEGGCELNALHGRQRTTLKIVLTINAVMFFVIVAAALYAGSVSLMSDSLDNLGDAITYALSIYAVAKGGQVKARVAMFKGALILAAALAVAGQIIYKVMHPAVPIFEAMSAFSLLGLAANGICLYLLWRHRNEDINMSSVWECSRNDIASNLSVLVAALGVWATGSAWPDLFVAFCLVMLLLRSAIRIITAARRELRTPPPV